MTSVWRYVKTAPLTYSWLVLLLTTTIIQHSIPAHRLQALLQKESTNLHHLASDPIRVLFQSLLWIDGKYWWPYLLVFTLFLAPAERWLGQLRWLLAGLACHVGATYLSEGFLYWRIQEAVSSPRLIDARDIGVSYFVVTGLDGDIVGVLKIANPAFNAAEMEAQDMAADRIAEAEPWLRIAVPLPNLAGPKMHDRHGIGGRHRLCPAAALPAGRDTARRRATCRRPRSRGWARWRAGEPGARRASAIPASIGSCNGICATAPPLWRS